MIYIPSLARPFPILSITAPGSRSLGALGCKLEYSIITGAYRQPHSNVILAVSRGTLCSIWVETDGWTYSRPIKDGTGLLNVFRGRAVALLRVPFPTSSLASGLS